MWGTKWGTNWGTRKIENAGFIIDGLQTRTYTQIKKGLNYFYCKRKVLADGISTTHLDV